MGTCERRVLFEHQHGKRRSCAQVEAIDRGLRAHEQFYREGLAATTAAARRRGRCFIATCVFGEGWQTQVLRRYRDTVLRPKPWGRCLIRLYYRVAPDVCVTLRRWPALQWPVRVALESIALGLRRRLKLSGEGACRCLRW